MGRTFCYLLFFFLCYCRYYLCYFDRWPRSKPESVSAKRPLILLVLSVFETLATFLLDLKRVWRAFLEKLFNNLGIIQKYTYLWRLSVFLYIAEQLRFTVVVINYFTPTFNAHTHTHKNLKRLRFFFFFTDRLRRNMKYVQCAGSSRVHKKSGEKDARNKARG